MPANAHSVIPSYDTDPEGRSLALVVFLDQTHQRYYHDELGLI